MWFVNKIYKNFSKYADRVALSVNGKTFTYSEIGNEILNLIFCINKQKGNSKRIGILGLRDKVSYTGALACFLSGNTYVPLNPSFPIARTISMIKQTQLDIIVVSDKSIEYLYSLLPYLNKNTIIILPAICNLTLKNRCKAVYLTDLGVVPSNVIMRTISSNTTAYILFTSGSTGDPKGITISYENLSYFLKTNQKKYKVNKNDVLSQTFDPTFDLSLFGLFYSMCNGAILSVAQPIDLLSPTAFVNREKITIWFSVPSIVRNIRKPLAKDAMTSLRLSLFCGDALLVEYVKLWQKMSPNSEIENLYGPTELTITCASYRINKQLKPEDTMNGIVSIGKVYQGLQKIIVDSNLKPVGKGETGELCIAGPQLFNGYLDNKTMTNSKMLHFKGKRFYRTGDLVRLSSNGNLVFLGRIDSQVKINGYRIELSEIEFHLNKCTHVEAAIVIAHADEHKKNASIAAFVTGNGIDVDEVEKYLSMKLPRYMIPESIHVLEEFPLNSNGKFDRAFLRNMTI